MRNALLVEAQTGIKIAGRNINNLRYADDTTLRGEIKEELKSLFNLHVEYIMWNAGLDESQGGIKTSRWNINNLRDIDDTLMAESKKELKNLLMKVKEESEKVGLKLKKLKKNSENLDHGMWSHHFMANRWGNNGNSDRLDFLGLQNHGRQWLQPGNEKTLASWKKSYDQPRQYIKKQRH